MIAAGDDIQNAVLCLGFQIPSSCSPVGAYSLVGSDC